MKNSTVVISYPVRLSDIRRCYHPMAEYCRQRNQKIKQLKGNKAFKFHNLARKLEAKLPRGLREKGDISMSVTCMILEVEMEVC
jgi:hypothetical protein